MLRVKPHQTLPSGSELPCSDDTPANNENQNFIPNYLLFLLREIWKERDDWYLGLVRGRYELQAGEPYWMPEIGMGLGRCQVTTGGLELEVLSWFDAGGVGEAFPKGNRYLFSEEVVDRAEARAELERQLRRQAEAKAERERQERDRERKLREEAEARVELERQRRERAEARLRELGIDPNEL